VRLTMSVPNYANLANDLNSVPIMPKKIAANLTQADFDSGKAMIGTGRSSSCASRAARKS
jgi:peptide/nickel transport system substrate-binding protein